MKLTEEMVFNLEDSGLAELSKDSMGYMDINVILTFDKDNKYGDSQEIFDLKILVSEEDIEPITFMQKKFFKEVVKRCKLLNRDVGDLIKISICSNWDIYESITGHDSLYALGHSCKWYFGQGRIDLDPWEKALEQQLGFGKNVDMSWVNNCDTAQVLGLRPLIIE